MKDVDIYIAGALTLSVCSSLTPEETLKRVNAEHPAGTELGWRMSKNEKFATGGPNPCLCERNPETHKHYLMDC